MVKLVLFGNGKPLEDLISSMDTNTFKIIGVLQDKPLQRREQGNFKKFLVKREIPLIRNIFDIKSRIDLILSFNYYKIIDISEFGGVLLLNLHIGLLPKYRGNNSNAWAVLNGEKKVGYTIHKVEKELDGGDIYYKFEYDISDDSTYLKAKLAIDKDIKVSINKNLLDIYQNKIHPISQKGKKFMYCLKLRPRDGIIDNWDVKSEFLLKKKFVFSKPLGTGLLFIFKGYSWEILELDIVDDYLVSVGIPGSIVYTQDDAIFIKTQDTAVKVKAKCLDRNIFISDFIKMGMRI